jgi:hypothetical protein
MSGVQRITQEEIQPLPRWARLAFAARCIRRAMPLLRAPADQVEVIERAVALTEQATRQGQAGDDLADAAAAAYTMVLNTLDYAPHAGDAHPVSDEAAALVTCAVAHAAAFAAEAATIPAAKMAGYLLAESVGFAIQAHVEAQAMQIPEVIAAMRADLQLLHEGAVRGRWGDQSPMPAGLFGTP